MIDLEDVDLKLSKSLVGDPQALAKLEQSLQVAQVLAADARQRVQREGKPATPPNGYQSKKRGYVVSKDYLAALGMSPPDGQDPDGHGRWESSAAFHKDARAQGAKASLTGGMWDGMIVRNRGSKAAIIDFRGSSLGRSVKREDPKRTKAKIAKVREHTAEQVKKRKTPASKKAAREKGQAKIDALKAKALKSRKVQNRLKAASVYTAQAINVIQPDGDAITALGDVMTERAGQLVTEALGGDSGTSTTRTKGASRVARMLRQKMRK